MDNILITGSSDYTNSHLLKRMNDRFITDIYGPDKENPDKMQINNIQAFCKKGIILGSKLHSQAQKIDTR